MNNCRYDLPTDNEQNLSSLTVIHTNCQSAMNKRSEISDFLDINKPHILALTEFGAPRSVNDGELGFEGYTLYRGDHSDGSGGPGRGAALYIQNKVNLLDFFLLIQHLKMSYILSKYYAIRFSHQASPA